MGTGCPRIVAVGTAQPPYHYAQAAVCDTICAAALGPDWATRPEVAEAVRSVRRTFTASRVEHRQTVVDLHAFRRSAHTTGERMAAYVQLSYPLARAALDAALANAPRHAATSISDFLVVSCTGYHSPGLDILLARDLGMPGAVRRVVIGHMGCFGALVGLRTARAALRADPGAVVALLTVELSSLHWVYSLQPEVIAGAALFGDAAAAAVLSADPAATGPALVDTYCAADCAAIDQMSWTVTDDGFALDLSPRVPVTLRRNVAAIVERLLAPHGLTARGVTHWLVHPGGPSILEVIQDKLELRDEQLACSWQVLREHGNCSSSTVLLVLDTLLRSGRPRPGEWGVMMAFGPGLVLETCLLRF